MKLPRSIAILALLPSVASAGTPPKRLAILPSVLHSGTYHAITVLDVVETIERTLALRPGPEGLGARVARAIDGNLGVAVGAHGLP